MQAATGAVLGAVELPSCGSAGFQLGKGVMDAHAFISRLNGSHAHAHTYIQAHRQTTVLQVFIAEPEAFTVLLCRLGDPAAVPRAAAAAMLGMKAGGIRRVLIPPGGWASEQVRE